MRNEILFYEFKFYLIMKKFLMLLVFFAFYSASQAQFLGLVGSKMGSLSSKNSWFNYENYYKSGWGYAIDAVLLLGIAKYVYVKSGGRPLFFLTDNFEVFKTKNNLNSLDIRTQLRTYLEQNGYQSVYTKRKNEDLYAYTKDGFDDVLQVKFKPGNKIRLRYVLTSKYQKNGLYAKETITSLSAKHKSQTRPLLKYRNRSQELISNNDKLLQVKKYLLLLSGQDSTGVTRYTNTHMDKYKLLKTAI